MYAYLKNSPTHTRQQIEGILIYPTVTTELAEEFVINMHKVTIATINLNQAWKTIETQLLSLISQIEQTPLTK